MLTRPLSFLFYSGLVLAAAGPSFPVLTYSTYLRDNFTPTAIATDSSGNIYMAGSAIVDPATSQTTVLLVKLNPQGTQYLYMRYLGGSFNDYANALAVDSTSNAYVAGYTTSPDFPVTTIGNMGTALPNPTSRRSFVAKFDPSGDLVFSDLLGGSAPSAAQAVAVNAAGEIVVTGMVTNFNGGPAAGTFPTTPGAYSNAASANLYLLELDPTGTKAIFSATGIGGSAVTIDSSGNIYIAGTTNSLTYPTTSGAYQSTFPAFMTCIAPCMGSFQGANQYVTKVDPTGSKLIYSTAVSGKGNTTNAGLAVDSAGNVYLTGYAGPTYPYTVTPPAITPGPTLAIWSLPFLSKLDPAGQNLLFSIPVGGAGVAVDSNGAVYVGGGLGGNSNTTSYAVMTALPALANIPAQCLPNNVLIHLSAYAAQVDGTSGNVLGSQFIGGSTLVPSGVALTGSTLWIAGATSLADFAQTPYTLTLPFFGTTPIPGAYLGAVDFSQPQPPAGTPQIACMVDSADLAAMGPVARTQLVTIFGTGLGPATGVSATDNSTATLGGVSINFGGLPTPLLYVSSTQSNFAVPLVEFERTSLQVTVNGLMGPQRQISGTLANPSLFLNTARTYQANSPGFVALALNADGSVNSSANPAQLGSAVSVFVNGLTYDPQTFSAPPQLSSSDGWSVIDSVQDGPFVLRVDLQVPSAVVENFACQPPSSVCLVGFTLYDVTPVPLGAQALGAMVYVNRP
jgi:uncharacterized protein (TIGR03437 family)